MTLEVYRKRWRFILAVKFLLFQLFQQRKTNRHLYTCVRDKGESYHSATDSIYSIPKMYFLRTYL